jgi:hypothetical protein
MTSLLFQATPPALTDGQQAQPQADAQGNLRVVTTDGAAGTAEVTSAASASGAYPNMPIDTSGFGSITWHFSTVGNGSNRYAVEGSNDGLNWCGLAQRTADTVGSSSEGAASTLVPSLTIARTLPVSTKYVRFRETTYVGGTDTVVIKLRRAAGLGPLVVEQGQGAGTTGIAWNVSTVFTEAGGISSGRYLGGSESRTSNKTAVTNGLACGDISTAVGAKIVKPYSIPEADWQFASVAGGIVMSTADTALAAAAGAGLKNYLTGLHISHDALGAVTEYVIKDGSTVIFRGKLQTAAAENIPIRFASPLKTSANAALNFALGSSVAGGVFVNAQGYVAP